jgi:hypothetical protein
VVRLLLADNCWSQALGTWRVVRTKSRSSSGAIAEAVSVRYEAHARQTLKAVDGLRGGAQTDFRDDQPGSPVSVTPEKGPLVESL